MLVLTPLGLNAVLSFWLAYILTRPLGANIGDFLTSANRTTADWASARPATSYIFLGLILVMVAYLQVTKRDRTPTEVIAAELAHERHEAPHGPASPASSPASARTRRARSPGELTLLPGTRTRRVGLTRPTRRQRPLRSNREPTVHRRSLRG